MNQFGSHPIHENLTLYEGLPPQGLSKAQWGKEVFFNFFSHQSAAGASLWGAAAFIAPEE